MADITGSLGQQIQEVKVLGSAGPNPLTDTQVAFSATGAASAINAQLFFGGAGIRTYISGFTVGGLGATAAGRIAITVTGLTNTMTFYLEIPAGVTTIVNPLVVIFSNPIPAGATNSSIFVNVPSFGAGNTDAFVSAWGFQR